MAEVSVAVEAAVSIACAFFGSRKAEAVGVVVLIAVVGRTGTGGR
ncbi:hypothetical protein [Streptomyces xanthochromogenes]